MQILHLQTELNLTCGITRTIYQVMRNAAADSTHFVAAFGGDAVPKFRKNRLPVRLLNNKWGKLSFASHIKAIHGFCKENQISLIHAHHRYFDLAGSVVARMLHIPIITSVHSKVNSLRLLSYKADHFIAVSESIKKHLITKFGISPIRITLINNFLDETDFENTLSDPEEYRKSLGLPRDRTIIAFIGRLSKEKGIDLLLPAFAQLQAEYMGLELLVVGNGPEQRLVSEYAKDKSVHVTWVKPQEDIAIYYQIADIIALPSRVDPFPLVMLECGFFEKPLVASEVDGIAEFIKDGLTGIFIKPNDRESLTQGLSKALDNAYMRKELATRLHQKVIKTSLKESVLPKYYSLYASLCG